MSLAFTCTWLHLSAMTSRAGTWLTGFGIGLAAGLLGPAEVLPRLGAAFGLLLLVVLLRAKTRHVFWFCLGILWAFFFNPPVLFKNESGLRVARQGALLPSASRIILSTQDGREFQAKGDAQTGDEGTLRCFKRSWFFEACRFRPFVGADAATDHPFEKAVQWLAVKARDGLSGLDRFEGAWLKALILGDESDLTNGVREDFKKTGLYHLLVVSGFHFTVLCRILDLFVRGPFQSAYVVGLIQARSWVRLACFLRLTVVACAFLYALLVGFQPPCQRALLGFAVGMLEPLFSGRADLCKRMQWTAALQTILFPSGFVSVSNLLSWGAYIFVVAAFQQVGGFFAKVLTTLILQLKLLVLSFALIGEASLVSIVTNAVIPPFFPSVFLGGLIRLFQNDSVWTSFIAEGQKLFVAGVRAVAARTEGGLLTASPRLRWILLGASLLLFWHAIRCIQNSLEGHRTDCYPRERAFMKGGANGKTLGRKDHPDR